MRWISVAAGAWLLAATAQARAASDGKVPAWMSGTWLAAKGDSWTEERWSPPRGGVMLGTNLHGRGVKTRGFEFLRIAIEADGTINYWGSPGGKTAVPFRLVSSLPNEVVFENPQHDYPTRITYRRSGNVMTATTSGPRGQDKESWTFRRGR